MSDITLPKDPHILLSFVNMKLRNQFSDLDELCVYYQLQKQDLVHQLKTINYIYDEPTNQFK